MPKLLGSFEQIAKICHEANRAYCQTIGDNSQLPWDEAPEWAKESAIKGVSFHMENLKRTGHTDPKESHQSWLEEKQRTGWMYGPVKDPDKKEHPCFVPYDKLPLEQQIKDHIFTGIVLAFHSFEYEVTNA